MKDIPQIRKLWELCFPDDSGFNDWFFENKFDYKNTLLYLENDFICAMLQEIPEFINNIGKATYIYGACTHKEYRRKGIMSLLLKKSFENDIKKNIKASVLIPAEEWLFDFYGLFGYKPDFYIGNDIIEYSGTNVKNADVADINDIDEINYLYESVLSDRNYIKRTYDDWIIIINMFKDLNGEVYCLKENGKITACAFVWLSDLYAQEILFSEYNYAVELANQIMKINNKSKMKITTPKTNNIKKFGAIKLHSDINNNDLDYYMNLMFN